MANRAQRGASSVRLSAKVGADKSCTVAVRYQDDVQYQHRETSNDPFFVPNDFDAEGSTGIAFFGGQSAGEKPASGWALQGSIDNAPAMLFPNDTDSSDVSALVTKFYLPGTGIAAVMLQLAPNFTLGNAHFAYAFKAH